MTRGEIHNYFHDTVVFTRTEHGWKTPFNAEAMRGVKLISDLVDAETGKVVAEAGTKMTPRTSKKLIEGGLKEQLVAQDELYGRYLATDIIDEETDRKNKRLKS